ncbi:hypothetical protein GOP47_0022918 [Adiantum capillus-veneris]|uniref:Folate-biopterin transporter 4 n=1 Tax=Adiantum capillus-veneris TaxID=13818 RepID=A0A9D4Z5S9_ADICA|nr:hypothetical protein GOP47_0022918 [Adiantum capillus-veneris]
MEFFVLQGFRSLPWMAISYQLKDELKLSPSASQFAITIAFMPWSIKPLYGILSDCIPIKGSRRVSYLMISGTLSFIPWLLLGLFQTLRMSTFSMTGLLTLQNFGSAMADVVIDAMIAEAARKERAEYAGDLQSMSWFAMALGGMFGSVVGGLALSAINVKGIFFVFSFFPLLQIVSCSFIDEKSLISEVGEVDREAIHAKENHQERAVDDKDKPENKDKREPLGDAINQRSGAPFFMDASESNKSMGEFQYGMLVLENGEWVEVQPKNVKEAPVSDESDFHQDKTEANVSAIEDSMHSEDFGSSEGAQINLKSFIVKQKENSSVNVRKDSSLSISSRLRETFQILLQTIKQPTIRQPMLWFFMAQVSIPSLSTVMFYYQTNHLLLDASFLGTARLVGWGALMLGTFIYNQYLKKVELRRIFWWTHIALALITLFDVLLVSGLSTLLGIPNKLFIVGASALGDAVNQFKFMPFLVLSGRLCEPGIEGTLFALFMSLNNLASTVSSFFGAGLASILHISSDQFENLSMGICIQALCTIFPIFFLRLIPAGTGVAADKLD